MKTEDYLRCDATDLAGLLRAGATSAAALMECAIDLARTRGPVLNAICHPAFDQAMEAAQAWSLRGPFAGVPFLLKDSGIASVRLPSSVGSRLHADTRYQYNATLVDRFESAGLLAFARTTVPEYCMAPTTEAAVYGDPTRNPWDLTRSSGGSSGGAAAAVAAGIVPVAHGSDGGGSIRIPAACCGVFGLKPSRGLVPMGPNKGEGWGGLACDGVISRSVRDSAAALDAIVGYEIGSPYAAPSTAGSYVEALERPPGKLRIGVWHEAWNGIAVSNDAMQALNDAARHCETLGHEIVEVPTPRLDYDAFIESLIRVLAANIKVATDARLGVLGRSLAADDLEPAMQNGYELGARLSATSYITAIQRFHAIGRVFGHALVPFDLVLTPALTTPPLTLGTLSMQTPSFVDFRLAASRYTPFLAVVNAAGLPAACLPIRRTAKGLPVACQILGPFGREDRILQLAAQLENQNPWAGFRPTLV